MGIKLRKRNRRIVLDVFTSFSFVKHRTSFRHNPTLANDSGFHTASLYLHIGESSKLCTPNPTLALTCCSYHCTVKQLRNAPSL